METSRRFIKNNCLIVSFYHHKYYEKSFNHPFTSYCLVAKPSKLLKAFLNFHVFNSP